METPKFCNFEVFFGQGFSPIFDLNDRLNMWEIIHYFWVMGGKFKMMSVTLSLFLYFLLWCLFYIFLFTIVSFYLTFVQISCLSVCLSVFFLLAYLLVCLIDVLMSVYLSVCPLTNLFLPVLFTLFDISCTGCC